MATININTLRNYDDPNSLFRLLLQINIEALEELVKEEKELKEWGLLLSAYDCTLEELKKQLNLQIERYKSMVKSPYCFDQYFGHIPIRWRRILMNSLYVLEEDFFYQGKNYAVSIIWARFFELDKTHHFEPLHQMKPVIARQFIKH